MKKGFFLEIFNCTYVTWRSPLERMDVALT